MLTAIGHDLRTPITRLKLRAEFIEDDEQRRKMLADLDELEAMVVSHARLRPRRAADEPHRTVDLAELLRTVLDEAGDARPEEARTWSIDGPDHFTGAGAAGRAEARDDQPVGNAATYGGRRPGEPGAVRASGDGLTAGSMTTGRAFRPEKWSACSCRSIGWSRAAIARPAASGWGLPIARNILRAHGGDVRLVNAAQAAACARQ